jgi:hypothetical protein
MLNRNKYNNFIIPHSNQHVNYNYTNNYSINEKLTNVKDDSISEERFNQLANLRIGPEKLRPYVNYYRKKKTNSPTTLQKWFRDKVWNSIPMMGILWIIPLYLIQVTTLILLQTEVIDNSILPVDTFVFDRIIGVVFVFLLAFTVANVAGNSKDAMYSLIQDLHGKMSEMAFIVLSALKEDTIDTSVKNIPIDRFNSASQKTGQEKVSVEQIVVEQRHIMITFQYLVTKASLNDYTIQKSDIDMLPEYLYYELVYLAAHKNNSFYLDRLLMMYNIRLDLLHRFNALASSTQVVTYNQSKDLGTGVGAIIFAGQDLNQPAALIDLLILTAWILLLYYPLVIFESWSFTGALLIILIPDLIFNGLVQFSKLYNDPFELALKGRLSGVDLNDMINETVRNYDQQFIFLLDQISTSPSSSSSSLNIQSFNKN